MVQQLGHPTLRLDAETFESILAGDPPASAPDPSVAHHESDDGDIHPFAGPQSQLNARVLAAIARTDQQIKETNQRLSHIESRLTLSGPATKRFGQHRMAIKSLARNLQQLSSEVSALLARSTGAEKKQELQRASQIDQMNMRLTAMEERQAGLESRIAIAEAKLSSVEARFEAAQAVVSIDRDRAGDAHDRLDVVETSVTTTQQSAESGRLLAEEISFRVESTARALTDLQRRLEALFSDATSK